jgi:hypothetical protein
MVNGTTTSKDFILTGAGVLQEDTNCQYFAEAFILLPVTGSYTNFTLTAGHVVAPDLPKLISPKGVGGVQPGDKRHTSHPRIPDATGHVYESTEILGAKPSTTNYRTKKDLFRKQLLGLLLV